MKTNSIMSDQAIIEVVKAHAEGRTIQFMPITDNLQMSWQDLSHSGAWNFQHNRYRVKPELWVNVYVNETYSDTIWGCIHPSKAEADKSADPSRIACIKLPDKDMS